MARLGLSDSMRSNASLEGTNPLHVAIHRQVPLRPRAAKTKDISSQQKTKLKSTLFMLANPLRVIVGTIVAVVLLSTGAKMLDLTSSEGTSRTLHSEEQLEHLERSVSLLYRDTARLKTTADTFLQHCQETQVAAYTRKEMLQSASTRSFDEQVKTLMEEHVQVTRGVLQYYVEKKQKIQETRERLIKMNISLPVEVAVRHVHNVWKDKHTMIQDRGELLESDGTGLTDAMKGLLFFAEKTELQDKSYYQQFNVDSISIQTTGHLESNNPQTTIGQSTSHGSIFFYVFIVCASAIYLRNAILDMRKNKLPEDKWSWSPVPNAVSRLKRLLGSFVVIENLRRPNNEDVSHILLEHIEPVEY